MTTAITAEFLTLKWLPTDKKQSQDASSQSEMSRSIKRTSFQALDTLRKRELYQVDTSFVSHDFKTSKKASCKWCNCKNRMSQVCSDKLLVLKLFFWSLLLMFAYWWHMLLFCFDCFCTYFFPLILCCHKSCHTSYCIYLMSRIQIAW